MIRKNEPSHKHKSDFIAYCDPKSIYGLVNSRDYINHGYRSLWQASTGRKSGSLCARTTAS